MIRLIPKPRRAAAKDLGFSAQLSMNLKTNDSFPTVHDVPKLPRAMGKELRAMGKELRAEGIELRAESIELRAEGIELRAEGIELRAEGIEWDLVLERMPNVPMRWFASSYFSSRLLRPQPTRRYSCSASFVFKSTPACSEAISSCPQLIQSRDKKRLLVSKIILIR